MIKASAVDVIMGCGHPWYDKDGNRRVTPKTYKYVGNESIERGKRQNPAGQRTNSSSNKPFERIRFY